MKRRFLGGPRLRGTGKGLALALGVQAVLALGMTVPYALSFQGAPEVRLQTQPVDPRDPLRGHYLTLGYAFSNVTVPAGVKQGQTVYLPLVRGPNDLWRGSTVQTTPPTQGLYLRGRISFVYDNRASVYYGIERFYLEEGLARDVDERRLQLQNPTALIAHVQVGRGGQARVVGVEWRGEQGH